MERALCHVTGSICYWFAPTPQIPKIVAIHVDMYPSDLKLLRKFSYHTYI